MTLSDLQGRLSTASLFKCDFRIAMAAVDMISTTVVRRAVSLQ